MRKLVNRCTRAALTAPLMLVGAAVTGAQAATLIVVNDTNYYVTISVDGGYGCNTAGHTTCTIPVAVGYHNLNARTAGGATTSQPNAYIPAEGRTWTISPGS